MSSKIKVSAIVSTYNSERFTKGCLQDLIAQTLFETGELEIIVVDSGSQQSEGSIVKEFQQNFSNIRYIRTETRETIYQAWNHGIKAASGTYITTSNSDDRHRKDALAILANELHNNPEIALVYADVFVTNSENQVFGEHIRCGYHVRPEYSPKIMLSGCHMGPQPMWRKSIHAQIGYFSEKYRSAGDYEFWCRIARHYPMKHMQQFLGLYFENPQGICNSQKHLSMRETAAIQKHFAHYFPPPGNVLAYVNNYQFADYVPQEKYVNICMVTYNRLDFTRRALESILKYTRYPHAITVVDNNSQDGTREYLQKAKRDGIIKNLVLLDENVGVARASNLAWQLEPDAEYYLKFDNDIVIQRTDWLLKMVQVIDSIPRLGAIAYNFEPHSYAPTLLNRQKIRIKRHSNLGGACILIPRRTRDQLGFWCEDYGLYGEEDADYGERIRLKGLLNAYMEDENIGIHLPGGKAAHIDLKSLDARDGTEEVIHSQYRQWKDTIRREILTSGKFKNCIHEYRSGSRPLFVESRFAAEYLAGRTSDHSAQRSENEAASNMSQSSKKSNRPAVEPKTSIIIVTYNSAAEIGKCVESVVRHTALPYELIIIDNCSADSTCNYLRTLKNARVIFNSQNLGFSKGCNQGIELATGEYIVLLNPDTMVTRDWDAHLIAHFKDGIGAVGPVSNYVAGKQKYEFHIPDRLTRLKDIEKLAGRLYQTNKGKSVATKLLIGFCMMTKRQVIADVGMLDENLFLGNDDLDFSLRLRNKGYTLLVAADTFIYHKGQASFASEPAEKTEALVQASTDALYRKLENQYRDGDIPTSKALWDMEWFKPRQQAETANPLTSIIILTHNQLDYTRKCLASVLKHTPEPFELIMVDNGSSDGTVEYLQSVFKDNKSEIRIKVIQNQQNLGFAAANNQGMAAAKGDYILLLNNDVVVTRGWLQRLAACAEKDIQIGLVGPRTNCVAGPQRVAQVSYDVNSLEGLEQFAAEFANQHKGQHTEQWRVVGFCMLIKRQVIDRIGGLDTRYGIGNFEDDDFCIRVRLAGFKARIAKDCFVHHFGGQTFKGAKIDYHDSLNKNWQIFKHKWNIPMDTPVGPTYQVNLPRQGFDPARHHCELPVAKFQKGFEDQLPSQSPAPDAFAPKTFTELNSDTHANPFHEKNLKQGGIHVENYEKMYQGIQPLLDSSNPDAAIAALKNLVDAFPDFAQAHNDLGVLTYRVGDKQTALTHYEKAVQLDPGNITFKKNLADYYYMEQQRVEEALQLYVDVLAIEPEDVETLLMTGHICIAVQQFDDAEVFYNRVLEIEPWNTDASEILQKLQNRAQAPISTPTTENIPPQLQPQMAGNDQANVNVEPLHSKGLEPGPASTAEEMYQQAQTLMKGNDPEPVIKALQDILVTFPDFALAHNDLGVLYYNCGKKDRALRHYEQAARLETGNITFKKNLADFYFVEQNRVEDALKLYVDVLAIQPEDVETLLITGHICVSLHRFDDAKVFYERVLEIEPWNADARQNLGTLESKRQAV
jgi:GT2 family glycosyltransferase/Flp pilus assembly protein TadD